MTAQARWAHAPVQVGSGTDPVEGAALAAALLHALASRAALTLCTTHQAPLKDIAVRSPPCGSQRSAPPLHACTLAWASTGDSVGVEIERKFDRKGSARGAALLACGRPIARGLRGQARDRRFENASVEFDLATLRPTYRLVWGAAGASNALAVAEGLGFDAGILADARRAAASAAAAPDGAGQRASALQASLSQEARPALLSAAG